MPAGAPQAPVPNPAATVAILRDGPVGPEVLLTHRPATMAFGPNLHVFPGGRLDAGDADPALLARLVPSPHGDPAGLHAPPFVVAAIREAWEEAGVLLATGDTAGVPSPAAAGGASFADLVVAHDLELRGDWLAPLSRWVTPPVVPRRYDTRFFVAWLPTGAVPAFDDREVDGHEWLRPGDALESMAERRIELWTPTSTTLQQLAGVRQFEDAWRLGPKGAQPAPFAEAVPESGGLVTRVTLGGAGGIPGDRGFAYLVGRSRMLVIDPGDPNDEAAEAILAAVNEHGGDIGGVAITEPLATRAAGAEGLALRLGVPVFGAPSTRRVLAADVTPLVAGEILGDADGRWPAVVDVPVRVLDGGPTGGDLAYEVVPAGVVIEGGPVVTRR